MRRRRKSRLRRIRPTKTMSVYKRSLSGDTYSESAVSDLQHLTATYGRRIRELLDETVLDEGGTVTIINDVFWFDPLPGCSGGAAGDLPTIKEEHILIDDDTSDRYEVIAVHPHNFMERLMVVARWYRVPGHYAAEH